jgi:Ca2+-binding EF-hand superfamily protein
MPHPQTEATVQGDSPNYAQTIAVERLDNNASMQVAPGMISQGSASYLPRLAACAAVLALASCGPDHFEVADLDGDGFLSKEEFGLALLEDIFATADADGDARITWEEWLAVDPEAQRAQFDQRDLDGDGAVTPEELKSFAGKRESFEHLFASIDTDGDGKIDRAEIKDFYQKLSGAEGQSDIEKLLNISRQ